MEQLLCDELVQEIFVRLPSSSSSSVSLVCKRWLNLHRTSINSLSLRINPNNSTSIPSFLSRYPHLSSLTIISDNNTSPLFSSPQSNQSSSFSPDQILVSIASNCSNLHLLRFFAGPVSSSSFFSLSTSCKQLTSLHISSFRPLCFRWLIFFPFLKELSFTNSSPKFDDFTAGDFNFNSHDKDEALFSPNSSGLPLESLCLSGIGAEDHGMGWLWRNCTKLRKLNLKNCEGVGDGASFSSFFNCLKGLQELELRTSRTIVDGVLWQLAEHCNSLNSLLLYDGGSREGLHRFISRTRSTLQRLDFRLPLDLDNNHLSAVAENFRGLVSLRLQSCCLVTGEGLKNLGSVMSHGLQELALINCDVVEREPGLLTTLGQNLRGLKKLDLSFNEMLADKELVSMLVSCKNLMDIKLRGCRGITNASMVSMCKSCKVMESVDIKQCFRIGEQGVEVVLMNLPRLRSVQVEENKVSDVAKTWASQKFIEVVD
ncbi:Leucine-rich repeat [Macleaya cordata]|uniref:Leucine-rich repeat n=1 Tax=Macleaya cordata TaxID=56857 RepID=A0A200RD43_MACCD|nr:Leucine-rich repeat [Macleaya cordata]